MKDFNEAFELVKLAVKTKFNMHRAGLSLILQGLFMVLVHEYLHSFGIVDEFQVRQMTYDLCSSLLGKEHLASIMAKEDPSVLFPELALLRETRFDKHFDIEYIQ